MSLRNDSIIPEGRNFIANPVFTYFNLIKQIRKRWIYNKFIGKAIPIFNQKISLPIFLPELGCLISLDFTSVNLSNDFKYKQNSYDSYKSPEEIVTTKLYNYNPDDNRAVSKGDYSFHKIDKYLYNLYINNLETEVSITPSVIDNGISFSPNRWFVIRTVNPYYLKCILNFNYNIIYIDKEYEKTIKKEIIWVDGKYEFYSVKAYFVKLRADGWMTAYKTKLLFPDNIEFLNEIVSNGEYFICFSISLDDYETSYDITTNEKSLNIILAIDPLVYHPCDIIPFILPYYIEEADLMETCYRVDIPKIYINKVIDRMNKFGNKQDNILYEGYIQYKNDANPFIKYNEETETYYVNSINPCIYPYLLKNYLCNDDILEKKYFAIVSNNSSSLLASLMEYQLNPDKDIYLKLLLKNYKFTSALRQTHYKKYKNIYSYYAEH